MLVGLDDLQDATPGLITEGLCPLCQCMPSQNIYWALVIHDA